MGDMGGLESMINVRYLIMILAPKTSTLPRLIFAFFLTCYVMGQDLTPQFPKIVWMYNEGDLDEL